MEKQKTNITRRLIIVLALIIIISGAVSALSYSPGIHVYDEASWVGLGFSEGTPAITRDVVGYVDDSVDGWLYSSEIGSTYEITDIETDAKLDDVVCEGSGKFCHLNISGANLIFYAPFDTNTSTVYDWSENSNDGSITGTVTWNSSSKFGGGYEWVGTDNSYIDFGNDASLDTGGNLTVSFWMKYQTGCGNFAGIVSKRTTYGTRDWQITDPGSPDIYWRDAGGSSCSESWYTATLPTDKWVHIVITKEDNSSGDANVRYYKNGTNIENDTAPGCAGFQTGEKLVVGQLIDDSDQDINGSLDEIMIFDQALTATEVKQIYDKQYNRFHQTGTQDLHQTIVSGYNQVNVTIHHSNQDDTNLSLKIYDGTSWTAPQNMSDGVAHEFTISSSATVLNLSFTYVGSDQFWSPILLENVTLDTLDGIDQDNYFSPWGRLVANDSEDFNTLSWSLLKIEHDDASDGIIQWNITATDGTKYVFDQVAYITAFNFTGRLEDNSSGSWQNTTNQDLGSPLEGEKFAYAWYLTEVRGIDYVDNAPIGLGIEDYGYWQKYTYAEQDLEYRFPNSSDASEYFYYEYASNASGDYYKYKLYEYNITFVYPESVYNRISNISYVNKSRTDAQDKNGNSPYRLDEIVYRRTNDSEILGKTKFEYDYSLASGKLTLKNVTIVGADGGELPKTEYEYGYNPSLNRFAYDLWGYYNGQSNANTRTDDHDVNISTVDAWTVTKVTLPAGGYIEYEYESNDYQYEQDTSLGSSKHGAGIRLKSTNVSDGIGQKVITTYEYDTGVVNHNISKKNRRLEDLVYLPDAYIEYENTTIDYGDYGKTSAYYVTSKDKPDNSLDYSYKRGSIDKVEIINETGEVVTTSEASYSYTDIGTYSNSRYQSGIVLVNNTNSTMYGITLQTNYTYNALHLLNSTVYYDLITTYEYAYENDCTGFADDNRYGVVTKVRLYNGSISDANMESYSKIVFDGCHNYANYSQLWYDVDEDGYNASDTFIKIADYTSYDDYGNLLTYKDGNGNEFNIRYDSEYDIYPIKGWNEEYGSESVPAWEDAYNNRGLLSSTTGPNNEITYFTYDEFGRILNVTAPGDSLWTLNYSYHFASSLSSSDLNKVTEKIRTDSSNLLEGVYYSDGIGRLREGLMENSDEDSISLVHYGERGVVDKSFVQFANDGYFNVTEYPSNAYSEISFSADPLMMPKIINYTGPEDTTIAYSSDSGEFVVSSTSERSNTMQVYVDKYGRITKEVDATNNETTYEYDAVGNLIKMTDADGIIWEYGYDNPGRMINSTHPDYGISYYGYDDNFNMVNYTDYMGTVRYTYDKLDRITSIDYALTSDVNYTYDEYDITPPTAFNYPKGQLTKVQDNATITYYFYDEKGRIANVTTTILDQGPDDLMGEITYSINYTYDYADRIIEWLDFNNNKTEYNYDDLSQITYINYNNENFANYTYKEFGTIESFIVFAIDAWNLFDTFDRAVGTDFIDTTDADFFTKILDFEYEYDSTDDWQENDTFELYEYIYPESSNLSDTITVGSPLRPTHGIPESLKCGPFSSPNCVNKSVKYTDLGPRIYKAKPKEIEENGVTYDITYKSGTAGNVESSEKYNFVYEDGNQGLLSNVSNASTGTTIMEYTWDDANNLIKAISHGIKDKHYNNGTVYYYYDSVGNIIKKVEVDVLECDSCSAYDKTTIYYYSGDAVIGEKETRTT